MIRLGRIGGLPVPLSGTPVAGPTHETSFAMMSTTRRRGPWQVGRQHKAFALMGGVVLDLREAIVAGHEVTINASVFMGPSTSMWTSTPSSSATAGLMGDYSESRSKIQAQPQPHSPVVRVLGTRGQWVGRAQLGRPQSPDASLITQRRRLERLTAVQISMNKARKTTVQVWGHTERNGRPGKCSAHSASVMSRPTARQANSTARFAEGSQM